MDHYLDFQVLADPEISTQQLMNNLFAKFHRTMSQTCKGEIGVSFPKHDKHLGDVLRLHGSKPALDKLMAQPWLKGLRDYLRINPVSPVPKDIVGYRTVARIQKKTPQNMRKRSIAKGWLTPEQALIEIPDNKSITLKLPYLQLKSLSNHNPMRVFVKHGEIVAEPTTGVYSTYGLSSQVTIPWF